VNEEEFTVPPAQAIEAERVRVHASGRMDAEGLTSLPDPPD
jgi:hypothetical protein